MQRFVTLELQGDVAVLTLDNPPVNALSAGVQQDLLAFLGAAVGNPAVRAVVITGAGGTFCGGADLREIQRVISGEKKRESLLPQSVLLKIEDCPRPVVMALQGPALGGGLELALAGHYRVAAPSAEMGLPEVKVGLIPGAGGTQRLPRLVGVAKALEMCATGEPVTAREALSLGLADQVIEGNLLEGAVSFARGVAGRPHTRTRGLQARLAGATPAVFESARNGARKTRRNQFAPLAAISAVEASTSSTFEEGCAKEAELFDACLNSGQSKAMIHAFLSEREVWKVPDVPKETPVLDVRRVGVIGAGAMGGGIAMAFANAGIPVRLKDVSREALERGISAIRRNYESPVRKGAIPPAEADKRLEMITPQLTWEGFETLDLIVEAVFEEMALKQRIFAEIDGVAKPSCLLATNTSTLDVDQMASATRRPEAVIGLHFFSPAHVMRLLEIVRGRSTGKEAIATAMALAKKLGKVGVLARNCRGFIGSRMMDPYWREAEFLVEEGASVEEVNAALYDFGMPMGPLAMQDLVGIDIAWHIRRVFQEVAKPGVRQPAVIGRLYGAGRYGQKSGRGWSRYDENRKSHPDVETAAIVEQAARDAGIERRRITRQEIVDRCIYAMVNEGARLLEEGIALRASDIDVVYLTGYGFPAWRGGPMFYADTVGLPEVLARVEEFESRAGPELWGPAPLLRSLAQRGKSFSDL